VSERAQGDPRLPLNADQFDRLWSSSEPLDSRPRDRSHPPRLRSCGTYADGKRER